MFRRSDAESSEVGFDFALLLSLGYLVLIVILIQFIADKNPSEESIQQGNVLVELYWDDAINVDVDLWVKGPGDQAVGYSNKGGRLFNLLRDDLGSNTNIDASGKNQEIAVSRGIESGEYVVNAHLFGLKTGTLPIAVRGVVSVKVDDDSRAKQLFAVDSKLERSGHEKTLVVFELDGAGALQEGSVHHTYTPLRAMRRRGGPP